VTLEEIYYPGTFHDHGECTEAQSEAVLLKQLVVMPIFGFVTSYYRFESICRFLHFIDNTSKDTFKGPNKLFKLCPISTHLNSKFQTLYLPKQDISIDESLSLWKGCLSFNSTSYLNHHSSE
jgi:hypothetical protein